MTEMSITEVPITAELIEPWFNDHAEFVKYITEHSTTINNSANPLRERLNGVKVINIFCKKEEN